MTGRLAIARAELRAAGERLAAPRGAVSSARRGLILFLHSATGRLGLGEASPLPGFSVDTAAQCAAELEPLCTRPWPSLALDPPFLPQVAQWLDEAGLRSPAARFAVETALLHLAAQTTGEPPWRLMAPGIEPGPVAVNAVVGIGRWDQVEEARRRGRRTIKVKLGQRVSEGLAFLRQLRSRPGFAPAIRVDANGAWTAAEAVSHLHALAPLGLEYVEEPVPTADLGALADSPTPLAVDESLARLGSLAPLAPLFASGRLRAVVLKPMLLGGIARCVAFAAEARARGAEPVVTHLRDGPVALAACRALARALAPRLACGVDDHPGLLAWRELGPLPVSSLLGKGGP